MKKFLLPIFFLASAFLSQILPSTTLTYDEKTGEKHLETTYRVTEKEGERLIQSENAKESYSLIYSDSYQLKKMTYASKENSDHYDITLSGSTLLFEGTVNGEQKRKTFTLTRRSWIQNFPFGLIPLAASEQNSTSFVVLNTKDLSLYQMRAKKMEESTITLQGQTYHVQRIEIRLTGFKGLFWKAEIWFDTETHQMVRYQTNEGPHTPTTTLEFVSKRPSF